MTEKTFARPQDAPRKAQDPNWMDFLAPHPVRSSARAFHHPGQLCDLFQPAEAGVIANTG
jgi:hypothetical protein